MTSERRSWSRANWANEARPSGRVPHARAGSDRPADSASRDTPDTHRNERKERTRKCSFCLTNIVSQTRAAFHETRIVSGLPAALDDSIVEFAFHEGARHREALRIWDGRIVVEIRVQLEGHDRLLVG